jgi:pSer/pThr/pTyr-binding forkhead associated (FHA) protein
MAVRVNGVVVRRFVVRGGEAVTVGRSPDDRDGIVLGSYLDDVSAPWISRNHLRLELRGDELTVVDLSTNGTVVLSRRGPGDGPRPVGLPRERPHQLGEWDLIQLHKTVEVGRADRIGGKPVASQPESVMGEAPTVAMRLPRP